MGVSVIAKQFEQWHKEFTKQYTGTKGASKAVIVDIDGTLSQMSPDRGPYDWDKVELDLVDNEVASIVKGLSNSGEWRIIILSGRDEVCRPHAERWLKKNGIQYDALIMRPKDDIRKDIVAKQEAFWNSVAPFNDVRLVIDDRSAVARMWRSMGLKVLQMGDSYIDF